jgi:hypothetical protein
MPLSLAMLCSRWNGSSSYTDKVPLPLDIARGHMLVVGLHGVSGSTSPGGIFALEIPEHDSPPLRGRRHFMDRYIDDIESAIQSRPIHLFMVSLCRMASVQPAYHVLSLRLRI